MSQRLGIGKQNMQQPREHTGKDILGQKPPRLVPGGAQAD